MSSVKRKACPAAEGGSKQQRRASDVACAHDCRMANKENELTCADDTRRNCGPPVNSGEASKMAAASSKYSDFTEVRAHHRLISGVEAGASRGRAASLPLALASVQLSKDHEAMTHILFGRNLRLKVAQTLWRRNASELVAYLIRYKASEPRRRCGSNSD